MKRKFTLLRWWCLLIIAGISITNNVRAQVVDDFGTFDPPLTNRHLIYAKVIVYDYNENGTFDAVFTLSETPISAWTDYSVAVPFYTNGIHVRVHGSFLLTNPVIPVDGATYELWVAVNVPAETYRVYAKSEEMEEPVIIYNGDAHFRKTGISGIGYWSALHNPDNNHARLEVLEVGLVTDSDPTLASITTNVGEISPAFNPEIRDYQLAVPYGTQSITINALPKGMGASVDMFVGAGELVGSDGVVAFSEDGVDVEIAVTALDGTELSYYVAIFVDEGTSDATLRDITFNTGSIEPKFNPETTQYKVYVPNGMSSVILSGVPNFPGATVSGDGLINLSNGQASTTIQVTSQDGSSSKSYHLNIVEEPFELIHSYRFDSGTATDVIGNAHGKVHGGAISEGRFTTTINNEYIELPAHKIGINNYRIVTFEAYIIAGQDNPYHTMLAYFGDTNPSNNYGNDYFYLSATNDNNSRASISIGQYGSPWNADIDVRGDKLDDGMPHHLVSTVTRDSISLFVDGQYIGSASLPESHKVQNIGNSLAYLGKSGYTGDQTWRGSIIEFNIYNGVMDPAIVALRSTDFPVYDMTSDATLLEIMIGGAELEGFVPHTTSYLINIEETETEVPEVLAAPKNTNSTVVITSAESLPGITTIMVTSENGQYTTTYSIEFYNAASDTKLSEIRVNGALLTEFDPHILDYEVTLPFGTTILPAVTATTRNPIATALVENATSLPGIATIEVTAENGIDILIYTIVFDVEEEEVVDPDPDPGSNFYTPESKGVIVFPTVSKGEFNVISELPINNITVYDISGRIIAKYTNKSTEQTITVQNTGVYILVIETELKIEMIKVIKTN
ncbi:cadherin-like beta sandwich domain-containing protein [Natronoflexus pectinivorans]|uniref:Putative secreted protein (Por secretion system target) n=1 Tax=Natronoflexus pectinivorans TaxID=682526 RepID=A0A4R2GLJ8_9BACT|nr:cadherin-like beta sandwich domain-containing protein [Natronoflexus pectinivorans]TCO09872.1 putative secreted protein (Por secretion system target) [Natronoflexus pectinivorans]